MNCFNGAYSVIEMKGWVGARERDKAKKKENQKKEEKKESIGFDLLV